MVYVDSHSLGQLALASKRIILVKLKTNHNFVQYLQKWYIFVTDVQFSKIFKTWSKSLQKSPNIISV